MLVIKAQTRIRPDPYSSLPILGETVKEIIDEAIGIVVVVLKYFEGIAIVPVQTVSGAEPQESDRKSVV